MSERWIEIETGVTVKAIQGDRGWSFDNETWHADMLTAYTAAKEAGTLIVKGEGGTEDGFHAWVISLLVELRKLDPGASVEIFRVGNQFIVTRKQAILPPLQVSQLGDLELRIEDGE